MKYQFDGYNPETVLYEHFGHHFCGESCLSDWLYDSESNDDEGDHVPNIDALYTLFAEEPKQPGSCIQCDQNLTYNDSQSGYGLDRGDEHRDRFYRRCLIWRDKIKDNDRYLSGYTKGRDEATGVGIWMPGRKNDSNKTKGESNVEDQKNVTFDKIKNTALGDLTEVKKRTMARQLTRTAAEGLAKLVVKGGGKANAKQARQLAEFLTSTPVGNALVASLATVGVEMLPEAMKTPALMDLLKEARVGPMADAADAITEQVIGPIRSLVFEFVASSNQLEAPKDAPAASLAAGSAKSDPPVVEAEPVGGTRQSAGRRKTDNSRIKVSPAAPADSTDKPNGKGDHIDFS